MTCTACIDGWVTIISNGIEAVKPCPFCRIKKQQTEKQTPITAEDALAAARAITGILSFPPNDDVSQLMIARLLVDLCSFREQAEWLSHQVPRLHTKWDTCGLKGLRQIFCSRYDPKDGLTITGTAAYPEGIPSKHRPQFPEFEKPPLALVLEPGKNVSVFPPTKKGEPFLLGGTRITPLTPEESQREQEFNEVLKDPSERTPRPKPAETNQSSEKPLLMQLFQNVRLYNDEPHNEPLPAGTYKPITAADIERELEKRRAEKNGDGAK